MTEQKDKPKDSRVSRYGQKRASGKMMYGPGCCAHSISAEQVRKARERAHEQHNAPAEVPDDNYDH
jgi:hypothetical protein